jgi:hypothetical protein
MTMSYCRYKIVYICTFAQWDTDINIDLRNVFKQYDDDSLLEHNWVARRSLPFILCLDLHIRIVSSPWENLGSIFLQLTCNQISNQSEIEGIGRWMDQECERKCIPFLCSIGEELLLVLILLQLLNDRERLRPRNGLLQRSGLESLSYFKTSFVSFSSVCHRCGKDALGSARDAGRRRLFGGCG